MPKKTKRKKVPRWGRSEKDLKKDMGMGDAHDYSADVPLGNTDPTMVQGVMYGGMPNASRQARGRLRTQKGKRD